MFDSETVRLITSFWLQRHSTDLHYESNLEIAEVHTFGEE